MNFEALVLEYLHERTKTVQQISRYFAIEEKECEETLKTLLEDSFVYCPSKDTYRSTPAGMQFVKSELEKSAVNKLPKAIEPDMSYPVYVMSLSKDKKKVMGMYDKRASRMDVYPILPDAMCVSGYAGAILKSHVYNSFLYLKLHTVTKNGKATLFKDEDSCISAEIAKRELEFLMLTINCIFGKVGIKSYVLELAETRCTLPSVTDGAHIPLNELFVLENHFNDAAFSSKTLDCLEELSGQCEKVMQILSKGKGYSKIPKILSVDISELC